MTCSWSLALRRIVIQQRPDDRFYIVSGPNAAGEYDSTPRDLKQLKASFSAEQLRTANGILQQSDFVFIRLAEEGAGTVTVPAALPTQRDDVRSLQGQRGLDRCSKVSGSTRSFDQSAC